MSTKCLSTNKLGEEHQLIEVLHCIFAKDLSAYVNALVPSSSVLKMKNVVFKFTVYKSSGVLLTECRKGKKNFTCY